MVFSVTNGRRLRPAGTLLFSSRWLEGR